MSGGQALGVKWEGGCGAGARGCRLGIKGQTAWPPVDLGKYNFIYL